MALLPSLIEDDLVTFGGSLSDVQRITGKWFAPVQGDTFSAPSRALIERFRALGAHGVGQSSWGPAVYGIVEGYEQAAAMVDQLASSLEDGTHVYAGAFSSTGARVWRQSPASPSVSST